MAALTFVKPQDPLGAEYAAGQLVIEEVLELAQAKGPLATKGKGGEALNGQVVGGPLHRIVS